MTNFFLIRHAATDAVEKWIAGREPGLSVNAEGKLQAQRLARMLAMMPVAAIYSSPLERARETAERIAAEHAIAVQICEAITEIDYGSWSGRDFEHLTNVLEWRMFNSFRSNTRIPGGELMLETQARVVAELARLQEKHPNDTVALVSHADVIRAAIGHYAGIHLDLLHRIEISPASVSMLSVGEQDARIVGLNLTGEIAGFATLAPAARKAVPETIR